MTAITWKLTAPNAPEPKDYTSRREAEEAAVKAGYAILEEWRNGKRQSTVGWSYGHQAWLEDPDQLSFVYDRIRNPTGMTGEVVLPYGAEMLRQVANFIEENPEAHDQHWWWIEPDHQTEIIDAEEVMGFEAECGTKACVAGWLVHLAAEGGPKHTSIANRAKWILTGTITPPFLTMDLFAPKALTLHLQNVPESQVSTYPELLRQVADGQVNPWTLIGPVWEK